MNPEMIHDALTLLPMDLIQQTDLLRSQPRRRKSHWVHLAALAACLVLVLGCSLMLSQFGGMSASKAAAPETPMMQAVPATPAEDVIEEVAAEEAAPEEYQDTNTTVTGAHEHGAADAADASAASGTGAHAYCGNTAIRIHSAEGTFELSGSDAITITDILIHLRYDPAQVCDCAAAFTVDTETITGIALNLEEGFARCELGQAALTTAQADTIREIVDHMSQ